MGARELMGGGVVVLCAASLTIAANATTAFDFGTPNDIYLPTVGTSAKKSGMRLLLVLTDVRAAGTTSSLGYSVQDADDTDGGTTIGTPATALTDGTSLTGTIAASHQKVVGIALQVGRPWLRVNAIHGTAGTDSYQCHATLLGIPGGL